MKDTLHDVLSTIQKFFIFYKKFYYFDSTVLKVRTNTRNERDLYTLH